MSAFRLSSRVGRLSANRDCADVLLDLKSLMMYLTIV